MQNSTFELALDYLRFSRVSIEVTNWFWVDNILTDFIVPLFEL